MGVLSRGPVIDHADEVGLADASNSLSSLIEKLTGFVRRQYKILVIGPAGALLVGVLYLFFTASQYTATATLLIDGSTLRGLQNQLQPVGDIPLDTLQVGSQVEVLASDKIALAVIRKLNLVEEPGFAKVRGGLFSVFAAGRQTAAGEQEALDEFASHRNISRLDRTYALDISFTSRSPVLAAKIANGIAEAYIEDQVEAKDLIRRRAGAWLQDRINELRAQVTAADRAVLAFKEKNNIVDLGGGNATAGPGAPGRLIGEQQLYELNSQLATARGATGEASARLERIEQVRKMGVGEAAVADTLRNEIITRLRNQFLDLSAREANLSARYGRDHMAAVNIRNQMEELRNNIGTELARIAASYQSDYEIAKARQENLERSLAGLVTEGQVTNRDRLGLTELESSAKIFHAIYDNFLQRYMEAIQQQSFPITDARVISSAAPPSQRSRPNSPLALAIAATMGLILSLGAATLRESIDRFFRTARQVEQSLRVKCLAVIPLVTAQAKPGTVAPRLRALTGGGPSQGDVTVAAAPSFTLTDPMRYRVLADPLSVFAEAFRTIKVAAGLRAAVRGEKVIGITSTLPNEGKSTVACNLAVLMADAGKRVILVDADLRNPTLVRCLDPKPMTGLMELLSGTVELSRVIGREPVTGLAFLPVVLNEHVAHVDEVLASRTFRDLIGQLREQFDQVIIDLPPIAPVADVRAVVPIIDSFVFLVEWGGTRINAVQRHLMGEQELLDKLLGVVLNKADLKVMESFEQQGLQHVGYYENRGYRQ